jgi:hypothetical protein
MVLRCWLWVEALAVVSRLPATAFLNAAAEISELGEVGEEERLHWIQP